MIWVIAKFTDGSSHPCDNKKDLTAKQLFILYKLKAIEYRKLYPKTDISNKDNIGISYIQIAEAYIDMKQYQKAIECNPSNPTAHSNLGTVYFTQNKFNEALQEFSRAVQLHPGYAEGNMNLGNIDKQKEEEESLAYAKKLMEEDEQMSLAL